MRKDHKKKFTALKQFLKDASVHNYLEYSKTSNIKKIINKWKSYYSNFKIKIIPKQVGKIIGTFTGVSSIAGCKEIRSHPLSAQHFY